MPLKSETPSLKIIMLITITKLCYYRNRNITQSLQDFITLRKSRHSYIVDMMTRLRWSKEEQSYAGNLIQSYSFLYIRFFFKLQMIKKRKERKETTVWCNIWACSSGHIMDSSEVWRNCSIIVSQERWTKRRSLLKCRKVLLWSVPLTSLERRVSQHQTRCQRFLTRSCEREWKISKCVKKKKKTQRWNSWRLPYKAPDNTTGYMTRRSG